jgi:hypothetical protein
MATINPSERTVSELRDDVRGIDDPDELRAMREAEADGKDRKSAKEAIERQLSRIGEESEAGSEEDENEAETSEDGTDEADESDGENEATEEGSESGNEGAPGTSVETTVVSASQRLDAIGAEDKDEKREGDNGTAETSSADGAALEEGDSRGIGTGESLDAIETAETTDTSTESGIEESPKDEESGETSRRATSEDLKRRLSGFGTDTESEDDEETEDGEATSDAVEGGSDRSSTEGEENEGEEEDGSADMDESSEDDGTAEGESTTGEESEDSEGGNREEGETRSEDTDGSTDTTSETMSETETRSETDRDGEASDESTTEGGGDGDGVGEGNASSEGDASLIDVRDTVLNTAADLVGRRLDGISGIQRTDEGWSAIVNVIERRSVPDTQDILGRYEITLDSSGEIVGYHRLNRYRRGDTTQEEWE